MACYQPAFYWLPNPRKWPKSAAPRSGSPTIAWASAHGDGRESLARRGATPELRPKRLNINKLENELKLTLHAKHVGNDKHGLRFDHRRSQGRRLRLHRPGD
jgi:hypothetical protein